ncbi:MAG: sigma-70 family RNA polymerase sigma factor [Bacteroidales bacterium]|nr:sigma-70 family RNA polymerase sigma factor [Bacteroidales bacterium]
MQEDIHKKLVERCIRGERNAQFELYKLYSKAMFNICCRMLNNRTDAEDMLQEIFSDAFVRLQSFRFDSTIGAWLKRITVNKCINEINRRKTKLEYVEEVPEIINAEEEEKMGISVDKVKNAMEVLPNGSRIVFSLYLLEGYDHEEIGQILNISESTSKTQYMRAKQKVKEILISQGYETR